MKNIYPCCKIFLQESWSEDLKKKLEDFLSTVLYAAPLPYLYKLFVSFLSFDTIYQVKTSLYSLLKVLQCILLITLLTNHVIEGQNYTMRIKIL